MIGKILVVPVRSTVWVGEIQLRGMMGGVMGKISAVRVRATVWVFEMKLGERTSGR